MELCNLLIVLSAVITVSGFIGLKILLSNKRNSTRHAIDEAYRALLEIHRDQDDTLKEPYRTIIEKLYNSNK